MTFTDTAVVLHRERARESDKRVILYSEHHGKIDALAVGAGKIKSKLAGHLEPLKLVRVMIAVGRATHKIAQARVVESFAPRNEMAKRISMLGTLARVIRNGTVVGSHDPELFALLVREMRRISGSPDAMRVGGFSFFSVSSYLGYAPELRQCVLCGRRDELYFFSASEGGVVCQFCGVFADQKSRLRIDASPYGLYHAMRDFLRWRQLL